MLVLASQLEGLKVISLRSGQAAGRLGTAVIDPHELKLTAFYVLGTGSGEQMLLGEDIRELRPDGVLIDDDDEIVAPNELVRLQKILKLNFTLIDKKVVTKSKQTLGKVEDYVVEAPTFFIQKLHVKQSLIKSLTNSNLIVGRTQIAEVTDSLVVVRDGFVEGEAEAKLATPREIKARLGVPGVFE